MWIKNQNTATRTLYNPNLMTEPVEFSANGTAQVPEDVGAQLIDHYDMIEAKSNSTSDT